jgi:hypothetical protein
MNSDASYRVFVSYTGEDLEAHAEVVSDMIRRLNADTGRSWLAIDHKYWSPTGRPSVPEGLRYACEPSAAKGDPRWSLA